MSKKMNKMDIHSVKEMSRAGMSMKDIAYVMDVNRNTISSILGNKLSEADTIADRMECFLGGSTASTGNFLNGVEIVEGVDVTFAQVAFEEELEQLLEELEKNSK